MPEKNSVSTQLHHSCLTAGAVEVQTADLEGPLSPTQESARWSSSKLEPTLPHQDPQMAKKLRSAEPRQHLVPGRIEVRPFLVSFAQLLRRALDMRIEVVVDVDRDCPALNADPGGLEEALIELAKNASWAMPEGGRLVLRASVQRQASVETTVLEVEHTGPGTSDLVLQKAVPPNFTTKEDCPLAGTGLPAVSAFIAQSGGQMSIASIEGGGTKVKLLLPSA